PNSGSSSIINVFNKQADLEFLGNPDSNGFYETLLPSGQIRQASVRADGSIKEAMTGDGVAGGAFMTGFVVVPNGHVVYARPGSRETPLPPSTTPDGSQARPYTTLAPEASDAASPANPSHNPNGGVNDTSNFFNFNAALDRNGNGQFDRSAFYAA